ncbi:hypothetical protein RUM43_006945 [Polyplax serrata]|uniref:Uncharacterized protein n=1 Tax=Polyplax serrata TaxID=468196 RepID=A0AAN8PLN9_POLSC
MPTRVASTSFKSFPNDFMSRTWCLMLGLGEVFVVGVCLLTLVRVPTVMSAPSTRYVHSHKGGHKAPEDSPSYMYPCGKSHEEEMKYSSTSRESDSEILKHIIISTKSALSYAESFRDRYVESTFHLSFDQHHAQWVNQKYDWLPNEGNGIPKRLGKGVDPIHLESKTFDEFLVNIYEHLQKFAVGLEQVVWDQKKTNGKFQENFRMAEVHLRNVLCEIRMAMIERNVTPRDHVPRSIMKDDFRHLESASYRNLRDWFIFRDLMNSLEYVIQVFTFIEENLPSSAGATSSSS